MFVERILSSALVRGLGQKYLVVVQLQCFSDLASFLKQARWSQDQGKKEKQAAWTFLRIWTSWFHRVLHQYFNGLKVSAWSSKWIDARPSEGQQFCKRLLIRFALVVLSIQNSHELVSGWRHFWAKTIHLPQAVGFTYFMISKYVRVMECSKLWGLTAAPAFSVARKVDHVHRNWGSASEPWLRLRSRRAYIYENGVRIWRVDSLWDARAGGRI